MHATSITQANAALANAHTREQKHKALMHRLEQSLMRKAALAITAGGYGAMTRANVPNTIKGFPWKLGVWALSTLAEALTSGATQATAGALADATMAVYTHDAVAHDSLVAGGEL